MIINTLPVSMFGTNCYIVGSESTKEAMVIDPGDEPDTILNTLHKQGLTATLIVLTHIHGDHFGALKDVKKATGATFAAYEDIGMGYTPQNFTNKTELNIMFPGPIIKPDRWLSDDEELKIGEYSFKVIHTPGHTTGGISLYGNGVLFSGDTLFNYGIGRTDLGGDYNTIIRSLNKLMTLPDDTTVYPGHGPQTTIGTEKRGNPFIR
jgi:glyoxylase-like metal-dependent hydrolase (beta-lactamase superfamily II)